MYRYGVGTRFLGKDLVDKTTVRQVAGSGDGSDDVLGRKLGDSHDHGFNALKELAREVLSANLQCFPLVLHFPVAEIHVGGQKIYLPFEKWDESRQKYYKDALHEVAEETLPKLKELGYSEAHWDFVSRQLGSESRVSIKPVSWVRETWQNSGASSPLLVDPQCQRPASQPNPSSTAPGLAQ